MFPRWEVILKHKDVLSFVYGLSNHPDDIIDLICDRGATFFAETALREFQQECRNQDPANLQINAPTHHQIHVISSLVSTTTQTTAALKVLLTCPDRAILELFVFF